MNVESSGGDDTNRIEYDSEKTMEGLTEIKTELDSFAISNSSILSKFNGIFSELSGQSITDYSKDIDKYAESAKLAEMYIEKFIDLMELVDEEIADADKKSSNMFDEMG